MALKTSDVVDARAMQELYAYYGICQERFPGLRLKTLSRDGNVMARTNNENHVLHLVDRDTGKTLLSIKVFPSERKNLPAEPKCERFSPDGKMLATVCGFDAALRFWDAATVAATTIIGRDLFIWHTASGKPLFGGGPGVVHI
jgi:WD40 repeat protein